MAGLVEQDCRCDGLWKIPVRIMGGVGVLVAGVTFAPAVCPTLGSPKLGVVLVPPAAGLGSVAMGVPAARLGSVVMGGGG